VKLGGKLALWRDVHCQPFRLSPPPPPTPLKLGAWNLACIFPTLRAPKLPTRFFIFCLVLRFNFKWNKITKEAAIIQEPHFFSILLVPGFLQHFFLRDSDVITISHLFSQTVSWTILQSFSSKVWHSPSCLVKKKTYLAKNLFSPFCLDLLSFYQFIRTDRVETLINLSFKLAKNLKNQISSDSAKFT